MTYKVRLEIFEGPLDLLLYLIKKDHINIYDIPIAKVTEQYQQYLELMRLLDLNIAGEFLVMAATLLQIKSRMLLPLEEFPSEEEEQPDPRTELIARLLEYEKFKEAAENLRGKEVNQQHYFGRPSQAQDLEDKDTEIYFEAGIFDLISAFTKALKDVPREVFYEVIKDEFTVDEKIHDILHLLLVESRVKLSSLFKKAKNKLEIVATFLAILELIRLKEIIVRQKNVFAEIEIARNTQNISPHGRQSRETVNTKRD